MKKIVFLLLITFGVKAQQYVAEAPLAKVEKDGFYTIYLTPEITALIESDFRNVRILDENNAEVPYLTRIEKPEFSNIAFSEYAMEKEQQKGCCTTLILTNNDAEINNIILEVRNADTFKDATLLGGDDKQTWYALKEHFTLSNIAGERGTTQLRILDFPLSKYAYYKIVINDSTTAPLNILRAGFYNVNTDYGVYVDIPKISATAADSLKDRTTWISIRADTTEFIDKIDFDFSGPKFYRRVGRLLDENMFELDRIEITSTHLNTIHLPVKAQRLFLVVSNDNNPSLKFNGIKAWQLRRTLTSLLSEEHSYKLVVGDKSMQPPVYDLEFFKDSIPQKSPIVEAGEVRMIAKPALVKPSPTFFTNHNIIWVAIILVAAILGYMSVRMIREKDATNNQ